ncbi:MAG: DUF924 family protein [Rhizobiaceae bacterium]
MPKENWSNDVLSFWFGELTADDWFSFQPETDATIVARFEALWRSMRDAVPAIAFTDADAALAATIVYDQFPRNMFRKKPEAFATDPLSLAVARNALARQFPLAHSQERRPFFYMPFMHSESLDDQDLCVELFGGPDGEYAKYAVEHRDIVRRFGRFPHRNRALGRDSTPDETAFLTEHAGYGQ